MNSRTNNIRTNNRIFLIFLLAGVSWRSHAQTGHSVRLDELDISKVYQGRDRPREIGARAEISIGRVPFSGGLHTRTDSRLYISLDGKASTFTARVGIDDRSARDSKAEFFVIGDGAILWRSGILTASHSAKPCRVPIDGIRRLLLKVDAAPGANAHVDWADGLFFYRGARPLTNWSPEDLVLDRRPSGPALPHINGAMAVGVRPGTPFVYPVAVTGQDPVSITVKDLPPGLVFDGATGVISGTPEKRGDYRVTLLAKNGAGMTRRTLRIAVGDSLALTPPMGWLSWNVTEGLVSATILEEMADAFVKYGLRDAGYQYIIMDDCWAAGRDQTGHIFPDTVRFPAGLKTVGDYLHARGFRMGIYSSPAAMTCASYPGTGGHEATDAATWASWGVDYLKYDLCSTPRDSIRERYIRMGRLLENTGRSILYALGAGDEGPGLPIDAHAQVWRTGVDIRDQWKMDEECGIIDCFDDQERLARYQHPGMWNDPDMLVTGIDGKGASANDLGAKGCNDTEYRSQMSLWALLSAPLFISADVRHIRPSALKILANPEVIAVDQDLLGNLPVRFGTKGDLEVWVKEMEDGSRTIGLLNRRNKPAAMTVSWSAVALKGPQRVRDLWLRKDLGSPATGYSTTVPPHGVVLIRVYPKE